MDSKDASSLIAACGGFGGTVFREITLSTYSGSGSAVFLLHFLLIHFLAANIEINTVVRKKNAEIPTHIIVVSICFSLVVVSET